MKFQYTKHKAKWDRIIKHLEKGVKQYNELSDLERVCCDDIVYDFDYACDYGYHTCTVSKCDNCPLISGCGTLYGSIIELYDEGNFEEAISLAKTLRDTPVKKGVKIE